MIDGPVTDVIHGDVRRLLRLQTMQMLLTAQEELFSGNGGGGVDEVVESVGGENLQRGGSLEDDGRAVASDEVNAIRRADG